MAVSRVKTWGAEILTFSDLNAEFDNILNGGIALVSPADANLDMNGNLIIGLGNGAVGTPALRMDADTDTGIYFGTGVIGFASGGNEAVLISSASSAVNYLSIQGSATGMDVELSAAGDDTDVDLRLATKGAGKIQFYHDSTANATIDTGVWEATPVTLTYGGTGADLSSATRGSVLYVNASGTLSALAPGSSGEQLTTQGAGADPIWSTA